MKDRKISPNAIIVALFGTAISIIIGIANESILAFAILIALTAVGSALVHVAKSREKK
ncbi:hypothetical protein [Corynebacterium otitidis]|uniref:Uncharacterized protein n=1 Tax=Corynebacterium otitidis ATCC 51513 TaxID=883169 RepID=K0Z6G0_9CORY|nr:hypothetical protein [Corynebacterium otitidis]EJZ82975.1 hypothetical protein HMPREF9719_00086 [Corynebacterium otitidis ATCC 51513]